MVYIYSVFYVYIQLRSQGDKVRGMIVMGLDVSRGISNYLYKKLRQGIICIFINRIIMALYIFLVHWKTMK